MKKPVKPGTGRKTASSSGIRNWTELPGKQFPQIVVLGHGIGKMFEDIRPDTPPLQIVC
jgi:hypothetical protein